MENETFVIAHYGTNSNTLLSTSPLSPFAAGLPKDPPAYHQLAASVPGIKRHLSGHSQLARSGVDELSISRGGYQETMQ